MQKPYTKPCAHTRICSGFVEACGAAVSKTTQDDYMGATLQEIAEANEFVMNL
jgi:hypothetical protein